MAPIAAFTEADARDLLAGHDIIAAGIRADEARRDRHGARTTFVRVLEVHVASPMAALPPRAAPGEIRLIGRPETLDAAVSAVRATAALASGVPLAGFALADLRALASQSGEPLDRISRVLRDAGLDAVSHVALTAEVATESEAIGAARAGGLAVTRLVVGELAPADRVAIVAAARALQAAAGGLRTFAPLPRVLSTTEPTTGYDDVKLVALARLVVDNIASIQVDWMLYGPKLAQVALMMGADDVDGVAAADPGILGTRRSPIEEIKGNIRAAALEPVERNGRYEVVAA